MYRLIKRQFWYFADLLDREGNVEMLLRRKWKKDDKRLCACILVRCPNNILCSPMVLFLRFKFYNKPLISISYINIYFIIKLRDFIVRMVVTCRFENFHHMNLFPNIVHLMSRSPTSDSSSITQLLSKSDTSKDSNFLLSLLFFCFSISVGSWIGIDTA